MVYTEIMHSTLKLNALPNYSKMLSDTKLGGEGRASTYLIRELLMAVAAYEQARESTEKKKQDS